MNSIFRKTLIASALTAMFSTAAIAVDDYSETHDGSDATQQGEMQQNESSSTHPAMQNHEDEFNRTIDAEGPAAGNKAETYKPNVGDESHNDSNRPLSDHQSNVTEEEEEEEELGNPQMDKSTDVEMQGQMDRNSDVEMDAKPYGSTGAGSPVSRGGVYDMSANDLNGMDVITSDGEDVGSVKKIVISPNNQDIHAVVSVGGFLGLGAKTILIPLDRITHKNDELHVSATQSELKAMTDYGKEDFVELEGDAAVSTAIRSKN